MKEAVATEYIIPLSLLKAGCNGKPEFEDSLAFFNISHHGHFVVSVALRSQPVGIDITGSVIIFSGEEMLQLFTAMPATYHQGFYWAAREAYLKYTAQGSRDIPESIKSASYSGVTDLRLIRPVAVMPLIYVEDKFARNFHIEEFVGAVIASLADIFEVQFFSTEHEYLILLSRF